MFSAWLRDWFLVIIGLLLQGAAWAESISENDARTQEESNELFEDIPSVYNTTKYDQKVTKAPPASMGVVTADEIKKYGYRTFGEIISSLKGFYYTSDRIHGYVGARGYGIPSDNNTRLLLLIDGHRVNDNFYEQFDASEGFPVDIDMIERVEIIRGPSSSMYGTSAFFGVVNVITKRGRDQSGASIKASYGSNDSYKTSISHSNWFENGLETFLSGTFYDSQGYKNLYYKDFDIPGLRGANHGVYENNDEDQSKKLMATVSYQDFTVQGLYSKRNKDISTVFFGDFNNPAANISDETAYIDLKYNHTFANHLNVQSRISYNSYRARKNYPFDKELINSEHHLARGQWWRAEINATKTYWDKHKITVGGEFQHNFDQGQFLTVNLDAFKHEASSYKWALLLQDEYTITEQWTLNTGVRLDYFSTFGKTINPRAGLIYQPWADTSFKLLYGSAFRAPSQSEQNQNLDWFYVPPLKPESLETLELIFEHYFTNHLRAEASLFRSEISGIIKTSYDSAHTLLATNSGNNISQGVELQLEDSWDNGFQARASYSWQQTTDQKTGARLSNSPEHMVKLNLIMPLWSDKVFLGFESQYMSSRKMPLSNNLADEHVINNVTFYTQKWLKGVELSASIYNLFDERYSDPDSFMYPSYGIPQDRRTFRVRASVDF